MSGIKFVREYTIGNNLDELYYDVLYDSNRLFFYLKKDLPKTVKQFLEKATVRKVEYDKLYQSNATIYKE